MPPDSPRVHLIIHLLYKVIDMCHSSLAHRYNYPDLAEHTCSLTLPHHVYKFQQELLQQMCFYKEIINMTLPDIKMEKHLGEEVIWR